MFPPFSNTKGMRMSQVVLDQGSEMLLGYIVVLSLLYL